MDIKDLMSFLYKHENSDIIKRYILNIKAGDSDSCDRRKSPGVPDAVIAISPITLSLMCHLVQKLTLHFLKKRPCQGSLKRVQPFRCQYLYINSITILFYAVSSENLVFNLAMSPYFIIFSSRVSLFWSINLFHQMFENWELKCL